MIDDHNEFIDDVVKRVIKKNKLKKTKEIRRETELATIESLMDLTDMSRAEIEQIFKETRKKKLGEQRRIDKRKSRLNAIVQLLKKYKLYFLLFVVAVPLLYFIIHLSLNKSNSAPKPDVPTVTKSNANDREPSNSNHSKSTPIQKQEIRQELSELELSHKQLISEIKDGNDGLVRNLVKNGTPIYLPENTKLNSDPFYIAIQYSDQAMLETLFSLGLDPFNNMESFDDVEDILQKRNDNINDVIFNHLVQLDDTPNEIKLLWGENIPYSLFGLIDVINDNNVDAIGIFDQANKGRTKQDWMSFGLLYSLVKSNFSNTEVTQFLNKLLIEDAITKQDSIDLASDAALLALQFDQYNSAEYYIDKGANPANSLTNIDFDRFNIKKFDASSRTLFSYAVIRGQIDMVRKFLDSGYQLEEKSNDFFMYYTLSGLFTDHKNAPLKGGELLTKQLEILKLLEEYGFKVEGKHLLYMVQNVRWLTNPVGDYNYDPAPYKEMAQYLVDESGSFPMDRKLFVLFVKLGMDSSAKVMIKTGLTPSNNEIFSAIVYNHLDLGTYLIETKIEKGYLDTRESLKASHQSYFSHSLTYENKYISTEQRVERLNYYKENNLIDESNYEVNYHIDNFYKQYNIKR